MAFNLSEEWERAKSLFPELQTFALVREPLAGRRVGECRLRKDTVVVEPGLTEAYAKKVLGHEVAHAVLGHGGHKAQFVKKLTQVYEALGYLSPEVAARLLRNNAGCGQVERAALDYLRG